MRIGVGLWLGLFIITPAWAAGTATTASRVFAADSPSIVVVKAFDSSGHAIAQGSGVVIAKGVVVSNCHVFEQAGTVSSSVFYHHKRLPATLRYGDSEHDLCSFAVKGLTAPPVRMGVTSELKVGENAYAIGAPEGLDLTLSNGIVSSLRKVPGGVVIQTTAPISPGSSGGGLFDSRGRLIGITSYYEKEGQQLNFALPVEWIKALPRRGKTFKELVGQSSKPHADFQKGIQAALGGDYAKALSIFKPLAEHGDAGAQYNLGQMYREGQGVPRDYAKAAYWYRKATAQGDANAQAVLGLMYDNGQGVPQDYAKAVYWLHKAAAQGNVGSQFFLGWMYDNGQGVPWNRAKAAYWFRKAAAQGVADAQYNLGRMYYTGQGVPQDHAKALYWDRKAAAQGDANAQAVLGWMYDNGHGVAQDYAKAAYWYRKAATQGNAEAQFRLGYMYEESKGVPQNYAKAFYWYREAAIRGNADAQTSLGIMYGTGEGVPLNRIQAEKWFIIGAHNGNSNASRTGAGLADVLSTQELGMAIALAREWLATHDKK